MPAHDRPPVAGFATVIVATSLFGVSNILAKLGLASRTQAALFAVEHHLGRTS